MEVTGETCKLCLKYIQGDDLALLDETILGKLEFLQMDLDQSVEESNALCKECEEKIESAFDFKSCLVNTESCLVPYVSEDKTQKVNLRVILEKDTSSSGKGESSVEKEVCRLCKNFVKTNTVISLPKVLKDDTIMEVFQGHIPEMDLDVTENPMVCDSCHNSLASFSTLIASWSIANGWNEDDEDMKEDFEMVNVKNETLDGFSDSKTNSSASFLENSGSGPSNSKNGRIEIPKIKTEIDEISDSTSESVTVPKVIKKEECADEEDAVTTIDQDLQLKSEEVEIKDEDGLATDKYLRCDECPYFTTNKTNFKKHSLVHKTLDEVQVFKCDDCPYITKHNDYLKIHLLRHKSIHEVETFKCDKCSYITKRKNQLKDHDLVHKSFTEVKTFKCGECSYISKRKSQLKSHSMKHLASHRSSCADKIKKFECNECSYVARSKYLLKMHGLVHRDVTEVETFKCDSCSYVTKRKCQLTRHALVHKRFSEVKTFKCEKCSYVAKQKSQLKRHSVKHADVSDDVLKCEHCSYTTNNKQYLEYHNIIHRCIR